MNAQHLHDAALFRKLAEARGSIQAACATLGVSYSSVKQWLRGPEDPTGRPFPAYIRRSMAAHLTLARLNRLPDER